MGGVTLVTPLIGTDTLDLYDEFAYPSLGPALIVWSLQHEMRVLDGKDAGKLFIPTPSQRKFITLWYSVFPEGHPFEGEFVYRGGAIRLARGSLKSPLGGWLSTVELTGPVRFAGWDNFMELGDKRLLLGKRQSMPLIQLAAVSEAQTANTFNYVAGWNAKDSLLTAKFGLDTGKQHVFSPGAPGIAGGTIAIVTSSAATVRGSRPSLVIGDELSEWVESNGGVKFYDTIDDNATKVDGARLLGLMNTWRPGSGSVAELLYNMWCDEQSGDMENDRPFLYWSREASPETDWTDPDSIASTLAYIYEECAWVNKAQVLSKILSGSKPITSSMREFGNLIVSDLDTWASKQDWDANASVERLAAGDEIVLALDPALTEDCTVLMGCRLSDGLSQPLFSWNPARRKKDLDIALLDAAVKSAFDTFKVRAWAADAHPLEGRVFVDWAEQYGEHLWIDASSKGVLAYDMRSMKQDFARAAELTASEISQGKCPHTNDPLLNTHVYNAQRRPYLDFVSLGRGHRDRKVDGAVTLVLARLIRRKLLDSAEYEKRSRSSQVLVFRR